ncbi:tubulin-tyrosine ligase family [Achlya hypogyna]|uniref:Tubulin--tyrosine ligase-like protein 5 n=1 Tax=Achlya hypogyna TaxID=1202772 RepID=A0A1V9Z4R3_ACHHY|nr:tubulin-tyrosine ligase family [Achlya hypogyna]
MPKDEEMSSKADGDDGSNDESDADDVSEATSTKQLLVLVSKACPAAPPVLFCQYPSYLGEERDCPSGYECRPWEGTMAYHGTRRYLYNAVKNVLHANRAHKTTRASWNLFWGYRPQTRLNIDESSWRLVAILSQVNFTVLLRVKKCIRVAKIPSFTRSPTNHFPGSLELGRKDKLCSNILRMQRKFGEFFEIIPETYITTNKDGRLFMQAYAADPKALWILKPPNQCCGRGIKLVSGAADYKFEPDKCYVAQARGSRYIAQPYLINGLKFDMRLYVLVTSFDPLRVYLFDNGLVRFCTQKYSTAPKDLKSKFGHLTNYSVNKKNKDFQSNQATGDDGTGSKWSYQALQAHFRQEGLNPSKIHDDIAAVIIKTLLCVESAIVAQSSKQIRANGSCFELYGFDVLLDASLRPWLLEVNVFPSMSSSSPMDKRIKTTLVCDTFQLVGLPACNIDAALEEAKKRRGSVRRSKSLAKPEKPEMPEEDDWIQQLQGEEARMGHFRRIFPTPTTLCYLQYFETPRQSNAALAKHLSGSATRPTKPVPVRKAKSFSEKLRSAKELNAVYN